MIEAFAFIFLACKVAFAVFIATTGSMVIFHKLEQRRIKRENKRDSLTK